MIFGDPWTAEQRQFATLVYQVWHDSTPMQWPHFEYIEWEMHRLGLDARKVLNSFPVLGHAGASSPHYADVGYDRARGLQPDTKIYLTVAGLSKLDSAGASAARIFMYLLRAAGKKRSEAVLDPFEVRLVNITRDDFREEASATDDAVISAMGEMILAEPRLVTGLDARRNPAPGSWCARIDNRALRFAEGITVEDYLTEVVGLLTPAPVKQPRILPSPLALLETLHYLNITWQLHCPRHLLRVGNVAAAARLAFDVGNADEFAGHLSAFGDLMKNLHPHSGGQGGHPVEQLKAYLLQQLPDQDDQDAINQTLTTLWNLTRVRNGLQHSSAAVDGRRAWQDLGLPYPPTDWNDTWLTIRATMTEAIMELRALIERLPRGGCTEHVK